MSQENVELVMESFRRFEANDVQGFAALWHPEGRATAPADWPEPGPFVGRDAVVAQFERLAADWANHRFENIEVVADSGGWVVTTYSWHTRGVASGIEAHFDMALANRVQDGSIREGHFRWTRAEALEAAGLKE